MSNACMAPRWGAGDHQPGARRLPPSKPPRRPAAWRSRPPAPSSRPPTRCTARRRAARAARPRRTWAHGHFVAQSDFVGKSLFVILILMSLVTWYLILVKVASNVSMRKRSRLPEQVLERQL